VPNRPAELAGNHLVTVRRLLPAPREEIWKLWTTPERMPEWILDGGSATLDVRVGGRYHLDMHYEGKSFPHDGEYLEVVPPSRLVFTWISEGTEWKPTIVTIELEDRDGDTEIVLTHEGLPSAKSVADHEGGWTEIMGWLDRMLSEDRRPRETPDD
jgi:uncharacterized protein YndB with AHSA1/START domain